MDKAVNDRQPDDLGAGPLPDADLADQSAEDGTPEDGAAER